MVAIPHPTVPEILTASAPRRAGQNPVWGTTSRVEAFGGTTASLQSLPSSLPVFSALSP